MERPMPKKIVPSERGVKLIHNPVLNKGTAFTADERKILGLRGLLPPRVTTQELQVKRVMANLRSKSDDLERYLYLTALQDRNENLFYKAVTTHLAEIMPLIYTPTVGQACQLFGHIYRRSRGLYISVEDKGAVEEVLLNWPHRNARVIVVTDGERILGLGDLGTDGMGIPIGKLSLYTACAGIHPTQCLPITIDVGTNNERLLEDPLYLGLQQNRLRGEAYKELLEEFFTAANKVFPQALIQLEDFATRNAFGLLGEYRDKTCMFNDDIQGTGSVALAGLLSALRISGQRLEDQKLVFLGAGEAGVGIADSIVDAIVDLGISPEKARSQCWFVDSQGLVCKERKDLKAHKLPYAHHHAPLATLLDTVKTIQPTALIGVSGQPKQFTEEIIKEMSKHNEHPIIFALSNPTSKSECTAEEAYRWSQGQAIFASGSPFDPVEFNGKTFYPGQGNNVYIFPGIGLGVLYSHSRRITDRMFLEAARVVSQSLTQAELERGQIYPSIENIREVSARIAAAVTKVAIEEGHSDKVLSDNLLEEIRAYMYDPQYPEYR
ncbi:MAG: NAD-dependent malic enzyme [Saprospiraceae bacterium]|nr:NAD-dependent malic enzyme [Saprospiraceae bacterium]